MSDLKLTPSEPLAESEVSYKIAQYRNPLIKAVFCNHVNRVLDEQTHSIYCEDCGQTLSLYLECRKLVERMKAVARDKEAMKEWYTEKAAFARDSIQNTARRCAIMDQKREERLLAVGVKIVHFERGGVAYEYPEGWSGLRDAEAKLRKKAKAKS